MNKEERDRRWASGEGYNRYISSELDSFEKNPARWILFERMRGSFRLEST